MRIWVIGMWFLTYFELVGTNQLWLVASSKTGILKEIALKA
jgi:hypothetical protein